MKKMPLYVKILLGMFLGILFGFLAGFAGWNSQVTDWVGPFGTIFMNMLRCVAVPLVFFSLIGGVTAVGNVTTLSKIGLRAIFLYVVTTVCAVILGLAIVYTIRPGSVIDHSTVEAMKQTYGSTISQAVDISSQAKHTGPLQPLVDIFPQNFFGSMSSNSNMLQIICLAIFVGIAAMMAGEKGKPFTDFIASANEVTIKVIDIIMKFAPAGVFALMAQMIVDNSGSMDVLEALGLYMVAVLLGLAILIWGFYPLLVKLFTKTSPFEFLKKMAPVQILAFTTSSSSATLPLNMEVTTKELHVSHKTTSFVLPVGMTVNMNGTSLYQAIGAVFIAEVMGVDLSFTQLLIIVLTTTISAIGTPGIPGGAIVILVMVLTSVGLPAEGLALIMGVDRPLDMVRTIANVTGDATVAMIVDKHVKEEE